MSNDNEKKFKIEELPDEGSSSVLPPPKPKPLKKETPDPRITHLKTLADSAKVEVMSQEWHFDSKVAHYSWMGYVVILLILESSPIYSQYLAELDLMNQNFFEVGGDIIRDFTYILEGLIKHPIVLVLLTPVFFKFSVPSDFAFHINFNGIHTVKKYVPIGSKEMVSRVFVKWKEIDRVKKVKIKDKEILQIYAHDYHVADIIWYIDIDKKRAIKLLLRGMIHPTHPLRVFLENEKELCEIPAKS